MINIGQRIHDVVIHQQCNITQLAADLGCDRKTVYRLFNKQSIDTHLLMRLSLILRYNFFDEYHSEITERLHSVNIRDKSATL